MKFGVNINQYHFCIFYNSIFMVSQISSSPPQPPPCSEKCYARCKISPYGSFFYHRFADVVEFWLKLAKSCFCLDVKNYISPFSSKTVHFGKNLYEKKIIENKIFSRSCALNFFLGPRVRDIIKLFVFWKFIRIL